ncbi:MAG: phosphatidate cytidylyltransferase, partial [Bacteroidota bacterium]|nr:phosphatidate cytidylyltransferase [Bacteroidota bacterium]
VQFFSNNDYYYWLVMGILISITSIVGDLVQSQFKRTYGVKNSGTILLGHGGMYDRIDSLIFTIPFIYLFIYIFQ